MDVLDLVAAGGEQVAAALRAGRGAAAGGRLVIDLGHRRSLPADAVEELVLTHRVVRDGGGRCAVVLGPALAAQLSLAYPEGILWASDRRSALALAAVRGPAGATGTPSAVLTALEAQFDGGVEAIIATDLAGVVTQWNGAAERLYGWTRAEALGRAIAELTVGPRDARLAREILSAVRRTGAWEGDFEVRRKDGTTFRAHVRDTLLEDEEGRAVGFVGVSVDRSERAPAAPR